jgi:signal transduction histidine kinase
MMLEHSAPRIRRTLLPQSMRWRLPLSYAGIALLATVALGLILLTMLRGYYWGRETNYLETNARIISTRLVSSLADNTALQSQVDGFAFLLQRRVRVLDSDRNVLADSGSPTELTIDLLPSTPSDPSAEASIVVRRRTAAELAGAANLERAETSIVAEPLLPPAPAAPPAPPANASDAGVWARYEVEMRRFEDEMRVREQAFQAKQEAFLRKQAARFGLPIGSTLYGFNLDPDVGTTGPRSDLLGESFVLDPATDQALGYVELSDGPTYGGEIVERVATAWALATVVATLLAVMAGWVVSRRMTAPLRALAGVTARMTSGDLAARAQVRRRDEIGLLAGSFNEMAGRIEEIVETLRRFVADAAHELNTPLTALCANLDLALEDADPTERARFLELARDDADRLESLANDLLDLSHVEAAQEQTRLQPLDIAAIARALSEQYGAQAEQRGIHFELALPADSLAIRGNEAAVRRAIGNLLENAIKFTPAGGAVTLRVGVGALEARRPRTEEQRRWTLRRRLGRAPAKAARLQAPGSSAQPLVVVEVSDTGMGIPEVDVAQIFSRFHRGRNAAAYEGSGLGLAIVKAIMTRHGGDIAVASSPAGTTFTLRWPYGGSSQ